MRNLFPVLEYPVIAFGRHINDPFVQLVPDTDFISSKGYERLKNEIDSVDCIWSLKTPKLFWRGSMHGFPYMAYDSEGIRSQRQLLIEWGSRNPEICDACSSHTTGKDEQLSYKYLVDIDGEVNAWSGLFWKLYSNSVVFKVSSHFEQWYYKRLIPWKHFIPVSGDLSDLNEKFEWAVAHDIECERIASEGRAFAASLTYNNEVNGIHLFNSSGELKRIRKLTSFPPQETFMDKKRVFIHSYQTDCSTVKQPPGLGDFLRGTITLYQLSRRYGFTLKLDFTEHPVFCYFEAVDRVSKRGKRQINEFFNQKNDELERFVAACSSVGPTFILTHAVPFQPVDDECRAFLCARLRPTKELAQHVNLLRQHLCLDRYCTVHLRMGDLQMEGQPAVPSVVTEWFRRRIVPVWGGEVLVVSDNQYVKNELAREFGVKVVSDVKPVHLGEYQPRVSDDGQVRDTLAEFLLMSQSQQIYRYSVYPWGSGFSDICAMLYQVPLTVITEVKEEAIMTAKTVVKTALESKVLNVGGNSKAIPIPSCYDGWQHDLLDIDPKGNPDVLCDARELWKLPPRQYDSIYCSHNLEHYHRHDVLNVLKGFRTVLKKDGFIFIRVPDIRAVMQRVIDDDLDIDDVLYETSHSPILVRDVIYGWHLEIERSGNDFFAHKTGFTDKSLRSVLEGVGFKDVHVWVGTGYELLALAFLSEVDEDRLKVLKVQLQLP